jgi:hypothetical protein
MNACRDAYEDDDDRDDDDADYRDDSGEEPIPPSPVSGVKSSKTRPTALAASGISLRRTRQPRELAVGDCQSPDLPLGCDLVGV